MAGKCDSCACRVIVDLSWSYGESVSNGIPSDAFLGEPITLTYPTTIDAMADANVKVGRR